MIHDPVEAIAIFATIAFAGSGAIILIRAISKRIAGGPPAAKELSDLRYEMEQLRADNEELRARMEQLDELQGRVDFHERVLAQSKDRNQLNPGRNG